MLAGSCASALQDACDLFFVPTITGAWLAIFGSQRRNDSGKRLAVCAELSNARDGLLFAWTCAERFAAFTIVGILSSGTLASATQLQRDHRGLVFTERAENLAHQFARGIVRAQIRFRNRDNLEAVALKVRNDRLLNHQITREPVQFLDHYQRNA